jgi:hypothetical protein
MRAVHALLSLAVFSLLLNGCERAPQSDRAAGTVAAGPTAAAPSTDTAAEGTSTGGAESDLRGAGSGAPRYNLKAPILPDAKMTPGDTLPVTAADICVRGYAGKVRNVPQSVKEKAYRNYGILRREKGEYEVDHLISLQLGGSNSLRNLWPQSFQTKPWNARVKDQLENELHREVCSGEMDLAVAQKEIATDWIAAYKKHYKTQAPLAEKSAAKRYGRRTKKKKGAGEFVPSPIHDDADNAPDGAAQTVWVNLSSGVYWAPGTQYYGKTKRGEYMTEAEALKAGYRSAQGQ